MKTEKFTELEVGYYKLVDKEGWCNEDSNYNEHIYMKFFEEEDLVFIEDVDVMGEGFQSNKCIITTDAYKFFEKVVVEKRTRTDDHEVVYTKSLRIGGGEHFLPLVTIASIPDKNKHYFVQHTEKDIPDAKALLSGEKIKTHYFSSQEVCHLYADIISEALELADAQKGYHLVPFSFILGYCMAKDVDLYREGLVEY